jgi:RHS repeat-associated protein
VTLPGTGGTVTFKYDPLGRRIEKSSTATTSIYAYDGDNLIEEANTSGVVVARYTQRLFIDEPLAMLHGSTTSYYQADALGSVTSLTNSAGAAVQTYTYDSFGNIIAMAGSLTNSFRYTGREFDPESGLYYYRARYFDPQAGKFVSEDPIEFLGGVNFYAYVHNDPVDFFDPTGLKDYNEQETLTLLTQAYGEATAGRIQGLKNIYNNSRGKYDFGWNGHDKDTFTRCGKSLNADQFGNYIAGFEGAAYDQNYFWTTGAIWAEASVKIFGVIYHVRGATKAKDDPWDKTGRPDINAGERDGWNFGKNGGACGCGAN